MALQCLKNSFDDYLCRTCCNNSSTIRNIYQISDLIGISLAQMVMSCTSIMVMLQLKSY